MSSCAADPLFALFPYLPKELRLMVWKAALPGPRVVHIKQKPIKETVGEWEARTGKEWPEMMGALAKDLEWESNTNSEDEASSSAREDESYGADSSEDADRTHTPDYDWFQNEVNLNRNGIRAEMGQAMASYEHDSNAYKESKLLGVYSESHVPQIMYVSTEARAVFLQHYTAAFHCTGSIPQTYFDFSIDTLYIRYDSFSYYFSYGLDSIALDLEYRSRIEDSKSLAMVQRLAILFDERPSEPPEVDLASIFGTFGGLKEFTIVLRHFDDKDDFKHYIKGSADPVEQQQLVMIEPMNVEKVIASFYNSCPLSSSWKSSPQDRDTAASINPVFLDTQKLEEFRLADCEDGECPWEMPKIDQKVVVPLRLNEELKAAHTMAKRQISHTSR